MAKASPGLIAALSNTVMKLENGATYQWGHMGKCNCGLLAQEILRFSGREIHQMSMEKSGDWATHSVEHCPTSGYRIDDLISELLIAGLNIQDLVHLERLDDPIILKKLDPSHRHLLCNSKEHLILYLNTWKEMLEARWLEQDHYIGSSQVTDSISA